MKRAATLSTMLLRAGVLCTSCRNMDFLQCDPDDPEYSDVEFILVDPSCSGSGTELDCDIILYNIPFSCFNLIYYRFYFCISLY
jgi:putative methyltransferase